MRTLLSSSCQLRLGVVLRYYSLSSYKDLFYLLFFFSINDNRWQQGPRSWSGRQLYYIEHRVEFLHCIWQLEVVDKRFHLLFYYKESKTTIQQFWRQMCGLDIGCIKENPIPWVKHQDQRSSLVIVPYYILLCLLNCGLGFFDGCLYSL